MKGVKEVVGSLKSNIKSKGRKGFQAIAKTAAKLRGRTGETGAAAPKSSGRAGSSNK